MTSERSPLLTRTKICGLVIAGFVIISLVITIFLSSRPHEPKLNLKPFEQLGVVMADTTAKLINNQGEIVLWKIRTETKVAVMDVPIERFRDELSKRSDIRLIAVEEGVMNQPPVRAPGMEMAGMSGEKFLGLIQKYPTASALVLFGATPKLTEEQIGNLPVRRPKVFVIAMYDLPHKSLFEKGVIQVAIVPRNGMRAISTNPPDDNMEWFERYYDVIPPDTAYRLP